jgi:hypothetical protein
MDGAGNGRPAPTSWRRHAVWGCVALAYLLVFPYFARLSNPNENVRIWTTRAIVAHGTFALDEVEREWGEVGDRASYGGHHYSGKAPGTSLLGVPVLFVASKLAGPLSVRATTWLLRVFTVALPLAFFLLLFGRHVERETGSPAARDLLVVALGLGTMLYPYGLLFVGHAQSAALLFAGYIAVARAAGGARPARLLIAGGTLAALAVVFEYHALFATAALAVFVVWMLRRRAAWFLAGALAPALLLGAYHTALFGRPWRTALSYADDPVFRLYHQEGFLLSIGAPRAGVIAKALFATDNGLFVFSAFLAAGLVAAVARPADGKRADGALVAAITTVMLLVLAGMANWRGGWCAGGPRYIATVVPFLVFGLALSWRRLWQRRPLGRAALGGAIVAAVVLCVLAGAHFPHYPLQLDNPVFDLTVPFIGQGYVAYGLGWALGLRGPAAYLPLALVVAAALGLAVRPIVAGARALGVAAAVAVCLLGSLSMVGRRPHPDEQHALEVVRSVWEPPRRGDGTP